MTSSKKLLFTYQIRKNKKGGEVTMSIIACYEQDGARLDIHFLYRAGEEDWREFTATLGVTRCTDPTWTQG